MRWNFPIIRRCWAAGMAVRANWLERHQHPFNFWIHVVGIPLGFGGIALLLYTEWYWALGTTAVGYFLQWVGHQVEGNDLGELVPLKRLLGLPVVVIAPQYQKPAVAAEPVPVGR